MRLSILSETKIILCCLLVALIVPTLQAQRRLLVDYFFVLDEIEINLQQGKRRAIRDIGLLLDKPSVKREALQVLQKYTAFTPREFTISAYTTKQQVLDFYYDNESLIQFSDLLNIFYITPFEERSVYYTLEATETKEQVDRTTRLRQHILRLQQDLEIGSIESAITQVERISNLGLEEGYLFLLNQLEQRKFKRKGAEVKLYEAISKAVTPLKDKRTVQVIIDLANDKILNEGMAIERLVEICNLRFQQGNSLNKYQSFLDSLQSVESMRRSGYNAFFNIRPYYFDYPADFYGKIFVQSDSLEWIRQNALQDLLQSKHPRTLYYLAIKVYRYVQQQQFQKAIQTHDLIQDLVAAQVKIQNWKKEFVLEPDWTNDPQAVLNYLTYWSSHFNDYTWDSNRSKFINKTISLTVEQRLKLSIQRLTSTNDSVALESYLNLVEAKPAEMIPLVGRFRPVLRNHNTNLPPIEFYYLEQLSHLVDFCKRNNITYSASEQVDTILQKLRIEKSPKKRYALERAVINKIALSEITAIEYWAMLNAANEEVLFSAGWILNKLYAKYWKAIEANEKELRLYLKKAYLFDRIGTRGICKVYRSKIDVSNTMIAKNLNDMLEFETDEDIISQIGQLINDVEVIELYTWKDLITTDFDLNLLPKPTLEDYEAITAEILASQEPRNQLKLILYLGLHVELAQVPYLMQLLEASKVETEVLALLEKIYAYDFRERGELAKTRWLNYWQADSTNYKNWGTIFVEIKLNQLNLSNTLSINDINSVTTSPFYQATYRRLCLEALKKVNPRYIRRLKIKPQLTISEDLKYIEDIDISQRDFISILKLFNVDNVPKTIEYILSQADRFSASQLGSIFSELFELEWFDYYLKNSEVKKSFYNKLRKSLNEYYETANHEIIQEKALIALAKLEGINQNIEQQLAYSFSLDATDAAKAQIQKNILKKVTYAQIPVVLRVYNRLSPELEYNFLLENFGLPIFDYSNAIFRAEIASNLQSMSKEQFYRHHLKSFGVDVENDKGTLDFEKIGTILRYDLTPSFAGSSYRNYYVTGVTRLLAIHFGQQFTLTQGGGADLPKSINYWIKYMEQRRIIEPTNDQSFSFALAYIN